MATAVAALKAKARRRIFAHFASADAFSAEQAVSFTPNRLIVERQFARMENAGVVRSTSDGRFWLDFERYRDWQTKRRLRVAAAGLFAVIAAAVLLG